MARIFLAVVGLTAIAYGAFLLVDDPSEDLVSVAAWLAGGVVLHDVVLSALVLLLGALVVRRMPPWVRAPAVVGFVVLGSVTLLAVPVLGRFGATPDNPTLLDRNYGAGWLLVAGLTLAAVGLATALGARRRTRRNHGAGPGR